MNDTLLVYNLIKTERRLTFDILYQSPDTIWLGEDDGDYFHYTASNRYEIISRSRMDIQTERLWLLGAKHKEEARSGTMVFSSNEKRDRAYDDFILALNEWAAFNNGSVVQAESSNADTFRLQSLSKCLEWDGNGYWLPDWCIKESGPWDRVFCKVPTLEEFRAVIDEKLEKRNE